MTIDELHDLQDKLCPNRNERGTESAPRLGIGRIDAVGGQYR